MRTAQQGDLVQVHYVIRSQNGALASSRGRAPLQLTVGIDHRRLPGLGLALVGLTPGARTTLRVPPERGYGLFDPDRVHRWSRERFPRRATLRAGRWVRFTDNAGRRRFVRILEISDQVVIVDANHRWAGQTLELEVELLTIHDPDDGPDSRDRPAEEPEAPAPARPAPEAPSSGIILGVRVLPKQGSAIAFDVDAASLASLLEALSGWQIESVNGASLPSLAREWDPSKVDLLILGVRDNVTETLALCRFLAFAGSFSRGCRPEVATTPGLGEGVPDEARSTEAPLLVLVPSGQETLVRLVLEAGAHSCLMLPIYAKEVASMLGHARAGNQPGRHTLNLERAQSEDSWQDNGGQG